MYLVREFKKGGSLCFEKSFETYKEASAFIMNAVKEAKKDGKDVFCTERKRENRSIVGSLGKTTEAKIGVNTISILEDNGNGFITPMNKWPENMKSKSVFFN